MTTLREAAQQALEALEFYKGCYGASPAEETTITALRAALAEPVQEPVAWVLALPDGRLDRLSVVAYDDEAEEMLQRSIAGCTLVPLYPAPPQRKPLTDEEIEQIADGIPVDDFVGPTTWHLKLARAIEAAHEIKE